MMNTRKNIAHFVNCAKQHLYMAYTVTGADFATSGSAPW
jgi:hypothetical protein